MATTPNRPTESPEQVSPGPSPIFIVGVNIDKRAAWWHKEAGNLVRVDESIYLDARLNEDERLEVLRDHALRITLIRRPNSHLCGSSAFHHGQVAGTVATIAERGLGATAIGRLAGAEAPALGKHAFVLNTFGASWFYQAGPAAFTSIRIQDSLGSFNYSALSDEALLLEAFSPRRTRPIHTMLNAKDIDILADKLLEVHDGVDRTLARIKKLADRTGQLRTYQRAADYMQRKVAYTQEKQFLHDFSVLWAGRRVGSLLCDGGDWSLKYDKSCAVPLTLSANQPRGRVPSFIASLLPERGLKGHEHFEEGFNEFLVADRYMSNISVRPAKRSSQPVIIDHLCGRIANFNTENLSFGGKISPDLMALFEQNDLPEKLARDHRSARISGVQFKLPVHLGDDGVLDLAHGKPFTHILKLASTSPDFSSMASNEFLMMHLAALTGIVTEHFSCIDVGAGAPAFLAERFDVRSSSTDESMILAEDLWSVMGMRRNTDKYDADLGMVGDILRTHSTSPEEDAERLFRQVVFSWVTGNQDMHLKNLMLLKKANTDLDGFEEIRLSPAYDLVCTQVYPAASTAAALKLENSGQYDARLLRGFAKRLRIGADQADAIMMNVVQKIAEYLPLAIEHLPDAIKAHEQSMEHLTKAGFIISTRCLEFSQQLSEPSQQVNTRMKFRRPAPGDPGEGGASFSFSR